MSDLNAAVTSAVAEATTEVESTPAPDVTPEPDKPEATPEPEAPEPKTADEKPPTAPDEEEFWNPTAEELAAIEKSPELKKVLKSMQKGFTKKTTEIASTRKQFEQELAVVNWIRQNPQEAIRQMAQSAGLTLAEAKAEVEENITDDLESKWSEIVGPDAAKLLRPLIEETAAAIAEQKVGPLRDQATSLTQAATERGIAATLREFGATLVERGEEWDDDLQGDMAKIATRLEPGDGVNLQEYVATLYDAAIAQRLRTKNAKSTLERLRRVRTEAEPANTARPTPTAPQKITNDMSDKDAVALAVRQAKQSLGLR